MGLSLGKRIGIFIVATILACSCDQHKPGEYPEVQRDKIHAPTHSDATTVEDTPAGSPSPAAKPTPAEFFPTKPR
ncbi:MAG TPA: hypothetical protein VJ719_00565 [Chthoniobacterales bacterium]|nr:hypothetical protein [Chthoniobacterales bacterium]